MEATRKSNGAFFLPLSSYFVVCTRIYHGWVPTPDKCRAVTPKYRLRPVYIGRSSSDNYISQCPSIRRGANQGSLERNLSAELSRTCQPDMSGRLGRWQTTDDNFTNLPSCAWHARRTALGAVYILFDCWHWTESRHKRRCLNTRKRDLIWR